MKLSNNCHLSYCTNIHPGESLVEVCDNLQQHTSMIKQMICPDHPFGLGLRLSFAAVSELKNPQKLAEFKALLQAHDFYVFTMNAFPYGTFGEGVVKENVYLPDWASHKRVDYTIQTASILSQLMPSNLSFASISTLPGAYKATIKNSDEFAQVFSENLLSVIQFLIELKYQTGKVIALGLEPEPCCFLETMDEVVNFFHEFIVSQSAISSLAKQLKLSYVDAELNLRQHLGVCLDFCHAAVEFEDPDHCLSVLLNNGISIVKAQVSSGLCVNPNHADSVKQLMMFDEQRYLHQVIEKSANRLKRFSDISNALAYATIDKNREWRVHFHVPVYDSHIQSLATTQEFVIELLKKHQQTPFTQHFEIETYTWNVLPKNEHSSATLCQNIIKELDWCMSHFS